MSIGKSTHSPIGASSMHRWGNCPGSINLCKDIPSKTNSYAEEGTIAHEMAAEILKTGSSNWNNTEMYEAVKVYTDVVTADHAELNHNVKNNKFLVEHGFHLKQIDENCYGTSDCIIYDAVQKLLRVYDYKHGAGISVDVEDNEQLLYYALGALLSTGFPCDEVELIIVQPRCPHPNGTVRRWRFQSIELLDFAADLTEKIKATRDPQAKLIPGEHCRFCPGAAICPALHSKALITAKEEFSPTFSYEPQKLSQTLTWLPVLEGWIKSVREFAYNEALHGRTPPGWKLVDKRASRKWRDEKEAEKFLLNVESVAKDAWFDISLKSPSGVEKLLPKEMQNELENFIIKESSGNTLAPDSDKRDAIKLDAKSEFGINLLL